MTTEPARFEIGQPVTILVGSHTSEHATVEYVVWSDRDRCHYFYLVQDTKKLSRGYRAEELAALGTDRT